MRKALTVIAFSLAAFLSRPASATTCTIPYTFTNGTAAQAAQVNSDFSSLQTCGNNIDHANISATGIYASQLVPGTAPQATFGSSQPYTFPNALTVNGVLNNGAITTTEADGQWAFVFTSDAGAAHSAIGVNTGSGYYYYALAKLDTANNFQAWLMGVDASGNLIIPNGGVQAQGAITGPSAAISGATATSTLNSTSYMTQTRSATAYGVPFDANSTSNSLNTHIEHNSVTVTFSSGTFICAASQPFIKPFTASPDISVSVIGNVNSGVTPNGVTPYILTRSTTAFTPCLLANGSTVASAAFGLSWKATGE